MAQGSCQNHYTVNFEVIHSTYYPQQVNLNAHVQKLCEMTNVVVVVAAVVVVAVVGVVAAAVAIDVVASCDSSTLFLPLVRC